MKDNAINVILNVHMKAVAGHEEELFLLLKALVEPTRAEPGCITYELHRHKDDPARFMFYERFMTQEALDSHSQSPHLAKFREIRAASHLDPLETSVMEKWKAIF